MKLFRMTYFILLLVLLFLNINTNSDISYVTYNDLNMFDAPSTSLESFKGIATGYGPDCLGCSGITASGFDVSDTCYYEDKEYGLVRIIAADKKYPFGTIIRISNKDDSIISIVLDRGSAIGNNKRSQADILFQSERLSYDYGVQDVFFEVLRYGF